LIAPIQEARGETTVFVVASPKGQTVIISNENELISYRQRKTITPAELYTLALEENLFRIERHFSSGKSEILIQEHND